MDSLGGGKNLRGLFPEPMIISPQLEHRQTFIILHGRGSTAEKFGPPLLSTATTVGKETLQTAFPHAKIIFPTASSNRATIYKRSYTHQWFDNWHLEDRTKRQDLQREGLRASSAYIHSLLQKEIEIVGKENVVLWGLSQGCATSLTALLTWDSVPFAAVVEMCGWLPFANLLEEIAGGNDSEFSSDPFSAGDEDEDDITGSLSSSSSYGAAKIDLQTQAIMFLRDEIEIEGKGGMAFQKIPVFLGHVTENERVTIELGREAKTCLELVGADVQMVEYKGCGHWYSEEMLRDIFEFLREKLRTKETGV
jgi:predicted esterase